MELGTPNLPPMDRTPSNVKEGETDPSFPRKKGRNRTMEVWKTLVGGQVTGNPHTIGRWVEDLKVTSKIL